MADMRIQYSEEMVGANHPAKADTLNRLVLVEHNNDGTHKKLTSITDPWIDVRAFGAKGDGVADDTAAIQAAFDSIAASGGVRSVYFPPGTFLVSSEININKSDIRVFGEGDGSIIRVRDGTDLSGGVLYVNGGTNNVTIEDLTIDGNSDNNSTTTDNGIFAVDTDYLTIRRVTVKNTPKTGIDLYAATAPHRFFNISHNLLKNIGWRGIDISYGERGIVKGNQIYYTGSHGITVEPGDTPATDFSRYIIISNNIIDRSVSPTTVLTGQTESGFLIGIGEASKHIVIDGNICFDNRTAGDDGIGLGGSSTNKHRGIVISNNVVSYAGGFGIDSTNNSIVKGNYVEYPATHGIVAASDLGVDRDNIIIEGNIVYNANESDNAASIAGIHAASLVSGTKFRNIKILNNTVIDDRTTKRTDDGVALIATNVSFSNVEIRGNDLKEVLTNSLRTEGTAFTDVRVKDNYLRTPVINFASGDTTPSVLAGEFFQTVNTSATTITNFDNGYTGKKIYVRFNDNNTTVDFTGTNLKGNAGVDWSPAQGDHMECVFDGTNWLCIVNDNT